MGQHDNIHHVEDGAQYADYNSQIAMQRFIQCLQVRFLLDPQFLVPEATLHHCVFVCVSIISTKV